MSPIVSRDQRPWGTFEVLSATKLPYEGEERDVVIKKIIVEPGKKLSLQSHQGRDESWLVLSGKGIAVVGDEERELAPQANVFVSRGTKHRISNTGAEQLVIIEISLGDFDESDIVRFEDDYGRAEAK